MGDQYRSPIYPPVFNNSHANRYAQSTLLLNALKSENATNNNDYIIDVNNLGLHNKDFALVTQASI